MTHLRVTTFRNDMAAEMTPHRDSDLLDEDGLIGTDVFSSCDCDTCSYNRSIHACNSSRRTGCCRTRHSGGLQHHVADLTALWANLHWAAARLASAGAHLRRRPQRSVYLARDGGAGAARREGD